MKRFITALLSLYLPLYCHVSIAKQLVDRTVVTVNSDVILESDIDKFQKKLKSKSYQELLGIDESVMKNRETVLTLLIEEKIIDQQIKKLDLSANDQEIDGQIKAILKRNSITKAQLTERLKQLGTSMDDYREGLKRQVERKNLLDREIRPSFEVTEEQLRRFYQRNAKGGGETQYRIAHILIEDKPGAQKRLANVATTVAADPADFTKFAKEFSDDTGTAENGGVLGFFSAAQLAKEFREIVPKTPVGQVTKPIKTSAGFHIIKVLESKAADFSTLPKEQRDQLRNQMISQEMQNKMAMWLERKKAESHIQKFAGQKSDGRPNESK